MKKGINVLKKKMAILAEKLNPKHALAVTSLNAMMLCNTMMVHAANSNTSSIDSFIDFACDWLKKIGGIVAFVGAIMFAMGWQREDAEGKSRGLLTMMAGFMVVAIAMSKDLFGL